MKIEKIKITAFRNLHNLEFECNQHNFIKGNNMQGKTNVINAIYWCITGTDLSGSNDNNLNIPFGEKNADVEITVNGSVIRRTANKVDEKVETTIYINNEKKATKQAENTILSIFGLLDLSVKYDTKSFKLIKFLLNPNYHKSVSVKELREFVIKVACGSVNENEILKSANLPTSLKSKLGTYLLAMGSISKVSEDIAKREKKIKELVKNFEVIKEFLLDNHDARYNEQIDKEISANKLVLVNIADLKASADEFASYLNNFYVKELDSKNISIVLLEKGVKDDSYKEVCYPQLLNTNLPYKNGSTAETIFVSCLFIETIRTLLGLDSFPLFIDEGETLDENSFTSLQKTCESQLFITLVEFYNMDGIKVC